MNFRDPLVPLFHLRSLLTLNNPPPVEYWRFRAEVVRDVSWIGSLDVLHCPFDRVFPPLAGRATKLNRGVRPIGRYIKDHSPSTFLNLPPDDLSGIDLSRGLSNES